MSERRKQTALAIDVCFIALAVFVAVLQAYQWRYQPFGEDIIGYLDVGDYLLRGDFFHGVSSYWSPMYGWLLALALGTQPPGTPLELPMIRACNCLIFFADIAVFCWLLGVMEKQRKTAVVSADAELFPSVPLRILMHCSFIYSFLFLGGTYVDTADLLVSGFILASVAMFVQIHRNWLQSKLSYFAFGILLGLGYLAKAIFFPIAVVLLAMLLLHSFRKRKKAFLACCLGFALTAGPFVSAVSLHAGRFTFSEVIRHCHSWCIMHRYETTHGRGPTFVHPTRIIFENPTVYEFAEPIGGTYPPWFDPPYWYKGVPLSFEPGMMLRSWLWNFFDYLRLFLGIVIIGFAIMAVKARRSPFSVNALAGNAPYLVPGVSGLVLYLLIIDMWTGCSERYLSPFVLLLIAGLAMSVRLPRTAKCRGACIAGSAFMSVSMLLIIAFMQAAHAVVTQQWSRNEYVQVADELNRLGVHAGDKICHLGGVRYYWARQGRFKIVADIRDLKTFWQMPQERRSALFNLLRKHHVKAIVQDPSLLYGQKGPLSDPGPAWHHVPDTTSYIFLLD